MNCRKAKRLILLDLDGEIDSQRKNELLAHLDNCNRCQRESVVFQNVSNLLLPPDKIQPSPDFLMDLKKRISTLREYPTQVPLLNRRLVKVGSFVLLFLLFTVFFLVGTSLGFRADSSRDRENMLLEAFSQSANLSIFNDIPDESLASVYDEILRRD